jgi:hypothetical protein
VVVSIHWTMPLRRIFQDTSISMRTPMVAVWKKRAHRIGRGRAGAADDLQRGGVLHVDSRLLGDIELGRVAESGGEVRVAQRDQAPGRNVVDSMMLTAVSGCAQPKLPITPSGPGIIDRAGPAPGSSGR